MTTHVLLITDRSGSMGPVANDVIHGFNAYLDELQTDGDFAVTSVLFNSSVDIMCEAKPLAEVPRLDAKNYQVSGFTALLDAVYMSCRKLEQNPAVKPEDKVLVVIQTDGCENASREANFAVVQSQIQRLEATGQWSFLYIGQGPDSWDGGAAMGVSSRVSSSSGQFSVNTTYGSMGAATRMYAGGQTVNCVRDFMEEEHRKTGTLGREEPTDES